MKEAPHLIGEIDLGRSPPALTSVKLADGKTVGIDDWQTQG